MEELHAPCGLDFDSTQQLVLACSELFRLALQLKECHTGLDDAITSRVRGDTKRRQYDQMKYAGRAWTMLAAKLRTRSFIKEQVHKRARVAKHLDLSEQRCNGLTERIRVLEEILRETPLEPPQSAVLLRQTTMPAAFKSADGHVYPLMHFQPGVKMTSLNGHLVWDGAVPDTSQVLRTGSPRAIPSLNNAVSNPSLGVEDENVYQSLEHGASVATGSLDHSLVSGVDDTREGEEGVAATTSSENLGPSHLLSLLDGCQSEASQLSVDSFGEPRDPEKAAEQQRLVQARAAVEERLRGPGPAGPPTGGRSTPEIDSGSLHALKSLGLAGFTLEAPIEQAESMAIEQAAAILKRHRRRNPQPPGNG